MSKNLVMRCACLLLAGGASAAAAQLRRTSIFIASVGDQTTKQPIAGAEVVLPDLMRHQRTESDGFAIMYDVPRGTHRVRVRQLGLAPIDVELPFSGDTTEAVFFLARRAQSLDPVTVAETRIDALPHFADAVNQRLQLGIGRFLTERELRQDEGRDIYDVITTRFPGLRVEIDPSGNRRILANAGVMTNYYAGGCPPQIWLDDVPIPGGDLAFVRAWDLAGIEYYRATSAPVQYRTGRSVCGLILLWSKR